MAKLTEEQSSNYGYLLVAEAIYLKSFNWVTLGSIVYGAPVFWKDPMGGDERSQDVAITTQKARVVSILKNQTG